MLLSSFEGVRGDEEARKLERIVGGDARDIGVFGGT